MSDIIENAGTTTMRIHDRILLGFLASGVAIGVSGHVSLTINQDTLEETIGNESSNTAHATMDYMFGLIHTDAEHPSTRRYPGHNPSAFSLFFHTDAIGL